MSVRLRCHVPSDFETLYEIDQACYEPAIAYSRRELRNYMGFPGADCIIAEADGSIVGFILTAHHKSLGYIITIDVLAPHRRLGLGSMLLAEAERRFAGDGVRQIALETATNNAAAIAFWHKHGYRKSGIKKGYYPGGRDAFSMIKLLPSRAQPSF